MTSTVAVTRSAVRRWLCSPAALLLRSGMYHSLSTSFHSVLFSYKDELKDLLSWVHPSNLKTFLFGLGLSLMQAREITYMTGASLMQLKLSLLSTNSGVLPLCL